MWLVPVIHFVADRGKVFFRPSALLSKSSCHLESGQKFPAGNHVAKAGNP